MEASTPVRTLHVSRPQDGPIGTLAFDAQHRVTLTISGTGTGAEDLRRAWAEMSAQPKLEWTRSEVKTVDGRKVTQIRTHEYGPNEPAYFYAVLDTLSRGYGFRVDIGK